MDIGIEKKQMHFLNKKTNIIYIYNININNYIFNNLILTYNKLILILIINNYLY